MSLRPIGIPHSDGRVTGREALVRPVGRRQRVLLVDPYPGVDGAGIAVLAPRSVALPDAREARGHELARRQLPAPERSGRVHDAEIGRVAHGAIIARPPWNLGGERVYTRAMAPGTASPRTVRDAAFDVFRRRDLTTMFANPGSTEVPFLAGLPDDLRFVLGLHESAVVGMASGYAIGRGEPALVLLHTTAGLGTAVSALATARVNRAPLVVVVGQQDRRHLAFEPFLAGKLAGPRGRVSGQRRAAGAARRTSRRRSSARSTRRRRGAGRRS